MKYRVEFERIGRNATIAGTEIACRGDYDQNGCGQMGRIAGRLGVIQFVDEPIIT